MYSFSILPLAEEATGEFICVIHSMVLDGQRFAAEAPAVVACNIVDISSALPCHVHVLMVGRKGQASSLTAVEATFVLSNGIELTRRIFGVNSGLVTNICA